MIPYMMNDKFYRPPLLYDLMQSKLNFENENPISIRNLAENFRQYMFDFEYPLSNMVDKEDFEKQIINHFLMRRIGMQTFLAFKIELENKMLEIMPYYNKIFDSYSSWDIFANGESESESISDTEQYAENGQNANTNNSSTSTNSTTQATSDRRYSKSPQNELSNIRDGKYVTDYNYDTTNGSDSSTGSAQSTGSGTNSKNSSKNYSHTRNLSRINNNKMELYRQFLEEKTKIMGLIYNDLNSLFYGLEDLY